jgi:uncharacterized membrane protein (UPF0127 family)
VRRLTPTGLDLVAALLVALATLGVAPGCADKQPELHPATSRADRLELSVADRAVSVELAITPEERGRGLMHRTQLGENDGMLFLFPTAEPRTFWMRNTLIPLDIIFLDDEGVVLNVEEAPPGVERPGFHSLGPARMVLELNGGWCRAAGLKPGDAIEVPADVLARADDTPPR